MSTPGDRPSTIPEYETIGYQRTFNTGNYENRRYTLQLQPNGLSFNEAIDFMEKDIQQREQMHKQATALGHQIETSERRLRDLQLVAKLLRPTFDELQSLITKQHQEGEPFVAETILSRITEDFAQVQRCLIKFEKALGLPQELSDLDNPKDDGIPF